MENLQVASTYCVHIQSWDISLDGHIQDLPWINRVEKSVALQLQGRLLSSFSAQSLNSYGHFSDLVVEIALSHRYDEKSCFFSGKTNKPYTAHT